MRAVWHYHHRQYLIEFPKESIPSRCEFINLVKHPNQTSLRIKLLKPVVGELPLALSQAYMARELARELAVDYVRELELAHQVVINGRKRVGALKRLRVEKVRVVELSFQAENAWNLAYKDNFLVIEALHKIECPDCPWNGSTILTRQDANGNWY